MEWLDDRGLSGLVQSPIMVSPPGSPLESSTSRANWNRPKVDFCIGKLSSISEENSLSEGCESCWGHGTTNLLDQKPLKTTFGKRLLESLEPSSNSELDRSSVTEKPTGTKSGSQQSPEILAAFPRTCAYVVTLHCEQSARSFYYQLALSELVRSTGAGVELASLEKLGKEPVWTVTLKILEPSSGVGTMVKSMLSSMNLEEALTLPICSDGWIDTQFELRSKALVCPCVLGHSGSLVTHIQQPGGQTWIQRL